MAGTDIFNWNKCFNDSRSLVKMRKHCGLRRRARQLNTKLKTPTPSKRAFKMPPNRRLPDTPKRFSSSRKMSARKLTPKKTDEWQQEYDIWNMMTQTLDQHLLANHKIIWDNQEIGIRDSTNKIRLIQNRQQLNQQIFVNSDGKRTHAKDLINPNESNSNIALRIKFRLVPVMQGFTIEDDFNTQSYVFDADNNEMNNNDIECKNMQSDQEIESDLERTLTSESEYHPDNDEDLNNTCDETITNISVVGNYSDFVDGLFDGASSTLIAEKENVPVFISPTK